jgi:hypothetical protein
MDDFKAELIQKANEYKAKHGANIIPSGAVYLNRK